MPASIEFVRGSQSGWRYVLNGAEVRIGRGAGNGIRIADPAWPNGYLRVQHRQGGYLVTNHLPHPIYLGGKLLPVDREETWYAGSCLQPTSDMLIRLEILNAPADSLPNSEAVVAKPPEPSRRSSKRTTFALSAGFAATLAAAILTNGGLSSSTEPVSQQINLVVARLKNLGGNSSGDDLLKRIEKDLRRGNLSESKSKFSEAKSAYVSVGKLCREWLSLGSAAANAADLVNEAFQLASQRIEALSKLENARTPAGKSQ